MHVGRPYDAEKGIHRVLQVPDATLIARCLMTREWWLLCPNAVFADIAEALRKRFYEHTDEAAWDFRIVMAHTPVGHGVAVAALAKQSRMPGRDLAEILGSPSDDLEEILILGEPTPETEWLVNEVREFCLAIAALNIVYEEVPERKPPLLFLPDFTAQEITLTSDSDVPRWMAH